jgi:hypothetical protein
MPHTQKNVVEAMVKELLANKEIRTSTSPYSSPAIAVTKRIKLGGYALISNNSMP